MASFFLIYISSKDLEKRRFSRNLKVNEVRRECTMKKEEKHGKNRLRQCTEVTDPIFPLPAVLGRERERGTERSLIRVVIKAPKLREFIFLMCAASLVTSKRHMILKRLKFGHYSIGFISRSLAGGGVFSSH